MASRYALVQFHPDPGLDDRIDIGVIAWDADGAHVLFIETWERVAAISVQEVDLLRDFAESVRQRLALSDGRHLDEATGELDWDLIGEPAPGVRLTPTQSAPQDPSTLISSLAAQFHYGAAPTHGRVRTRQTAASHAYHAILDALRKRAPRRAKALVHARRSLEGRFGEHEFDVVLAAEKPLAAVRALSFEVSSPRHLQRDVDAAAWALDDLRKRYKDLPLAVFVLPPTSPEAEAISRAASKVFKGVGASLIDAEPRLAKWALQHAGDLTAVETGKAGAGQRSHAKAASPARSRKRAA
jgi:hypothetical protein